MRREAGKVKKWAGEGETRALYNKDTVLDGHTASRKPSPVSYLSSKALVFFHDASSLGTSLTQLSVLPARMTTQGPETFSGHNWITALCLKQRMCLRNSR